MSESQDHMEDIIKEEKEREMLNEITDGQMDIWIDENKESLKDEYLENCKDDFKEFCEMRWGEDNE